LNPVLTIGRQIAESSRIGREPLVDMLAGLGFADPRRILDAYPFMLSGGENQRCLLAMALASGSELLILDEPAAELDPTAQEDFMRMVQASRRRTGLTVLLITHQLDRVREIAENIYIMHAGAIVDSGTCAAVLAAPGHAYTREIRAYLDGR
jgi:ABC-type dipeptide/oligopeptide/nickel transport system ATPase component